MPLCASYLFIQHTGDYCACRYRWQLDIPRDLLEPEEIEKDKYEHGASEYAESVSGCSFRQIHRMPPSCSSPL